MDTKTFLFASLDAARIGDVAWQVHRESHYFRELVDNSWRCTDRQTEGTAA